MSRAISRDSFNELKNYLGVYLQQGRVILDADWNENQDIAVSCLRRLTRESLGEGSPNRGFAIDPLFLAKSDAPFLSGAGSLSLWGSLISFFVSFPGTAVEDFESIDGWKLSSPQGDVRISHDRPYEGSGCLRVSGHPGTVRVTRTLASTTDLSAFDLVTFRYRLSQNNGADFKFFLEDDNGNRSAWIFHRLPIGKELWLTGIAGPMDLRFRILTETLPDGFQLSSYSAQANSIGGTLPITWSVSAGTVPAGFTVTPGGGADSKIGTIQGPAGASGVFTFTVKAADAAGRTATKALSLTVKPGPAPSIRSSIPSELERLSGAAEAEITTPAPADLTKIRRYGFEISQDATNPLVWDFDDLRTGSIAQLEQAGANNFVIRGSQANQALNEAALSALFLRTLVLGLGGTQAQIDLVAASFQFAEPGLENAGRLYVAGLPCEQVPDLLYSDQADPNDAPLAPPPAGVVRKDLVYLDAWQEPVTYVEDTNIREVALGGPDTSTRLRLRQRVRVSQGAGSQPGVLPAGNGTGLGTLATAGSYAGQANRLYRIQIDTPGEIGAATFRWSDDNASTIQRVIEAIPPGSRRVVVEDAAAFHPGDQILIAKEFGGEQHTVASVFRNAITLQNPTGTQLAALPATARRPNFTTFALQDHPRVQRWNAFQVPIKRDTSDTLTSALIPLNDGVQVQFGGRAMLAGDYWNFRTRLLAGDELAGIDSSSRIEKLSFQRARGVKHHYTPLALVVRDGSDPRPNQINNILDRRQHVSNAVVLPKLLSPVTGITGTVLTNIGGFPIQPGSRESRLVVLWNCELFVTTPGNVQPNGGIEIRVNFYSDAVTNPATDPDTGKMLEQSAFFGLNRKPVNSEIPLSLVFAKAIDSSPSQPQLAVPTSVQFFVKLNGTGYTVQLQNIQVVLMDLKKSV